MRIDVTSADWDAAALALSAGNQGTAAIYQTLGAAVLTGSGMAGDDATSTDFAAAYDTAAQVALDALGRLVDGFGTLSRLTRASLDHHRRAEQASTITCGDRMVTTYDPDDLPAPAQLVGVERIVVAPSRGGQTFAINGHVQWVLDRVQGFCWPNADVARLRTVGAAWLAAAHAVDELTRHNATAERGLTRQRSPEVPVAMSAIESFDSTRSGLALQLSTVGRSCQAYADDVDQHRTEIIDFVAELLAGAVIVEGIGLVLGAVSAGLTAAGATAINAARIAAATPRILAIVEAQGAMARISASGLQLARSSLVVVDMALAQLNKARVLSFTAHALAGVAEMGPINPAPLPPVPATPFLPVDLCQHEGMGGAHTVKKHVGLSDADLRQRVQDTGLPNASTFKDLATAERTIDQVIAQHRNRVTAWLAGTKLKLRIDEDSGGSIGRTMYADGHVQETSGVRMILKRSVTMPDGFVVLTAFPDPDNEVP